MQCVLEYVSGRGMTVGGNGPPLLTALISPPEELDLPTSYLRART